MSTTSTFAVWRILVCMGKLHEHPEHHSQEQVPHGDIVVDQRVYRHYSNRKRILDTEHDDGLDDARRLALRNQTTIDQTLMVRGIITVLEQAPATDDRGQTQPDAYAVYFPADHPEYEQVVTAVDRLVKDRNRADYATHLAPDHAVLDADKAWEVLTPGEADTIITNVLQAQSSSMAA